MRSVIRTTLKVGRLVPQWSQGFAHFYVRGHVFVCKSGYFNDGDFLVRFHGAFQGNPYTVVVSVLLTFSVDPCLAAPRFRHIFVNERKNMYLLE